MKFDTKNFHLNDLENELYVQRVAYYPWRVSQVNIQVMCINKHNLSARVPKSPLKETTSKSNAQL